MKFFLGMVLCAVGGGIAGYFGNVPAVIGVVTAQTGMLIIALR